MTDDPLRVPHEVVHRWLSEDSYWARGRSRAIVDRSIDGSLPFSMVDAGGDPAGFCRMVTDRATFAWLCDVYVAPSHRGLGAGTFLVRTAVEHPAVARLRQVLGTKDAHGLYEKFGFASFGDSETARWMIKQGG